MDKLKQLSATLKKANIPHEIDLKGLKYINGNYYLHAALLDGKLETYGNLNQQYGSRTDWRENLSVEQVFNRIKWCHDGNKPLEYLPPHGKSMKEWNESRENFDKFVEVGDIVDVDIYNHFLNILPPAYNSLGLLQVGEPVDYVKGKPTFSTFTKDTDGFWMYRGECFWGSCEAVG